MIRIPRLFVLAKDIMTITGKSLRSCQRMLSKIRKAIGKQSHQVITPDEFCEYYQLRGKDKDRFIGGFE
ncbi:MAG: hypothetical protein IPK91_04420 [Saprospiraceae bacterium]|jgi:hypothetical protein|nr:hypothetical protein [Saprospiraceae bacterium]MBK8296521.1 hypothetical protein [Saprospiraceae bacterium]